MPSKSRPIDCVSAIEVNGLSFFKKFLSSKIQFMFWNGFRLHFCVESFILSRYHLWVNMFFYEDPLNDWKITEMMTVLLITRQIAVIFYRYTHTSIPYPPHPSHHTPPTVFKKITDISVSSVDQRAISRTVISIATETSVYAMSGK